MPLESYHLGNCLFIQPNNVIDLDVLIQKSGVGEEFPLSARSPAVSTGQMLQEKGGAVWAGNRGRRKGELFIGLSARSQPAHKAHTLD